jgi:parallel beta-helix repeat protein
MKRIKRALVLCGIVVAFTGLTAIKAEATTFTVNPGQSIQAAVNSAGPNAVITIAPGTYKESVVVVKNNITIRGAGASSTFVVPPTNAAMNNCKQAVNENDGFCVFSPTFNPANPVKRVEISGLNVSNFGGTGIIGFGTDYLSVHDVRAAHNTEYGIARFASTHSTITNNTVSGSDEAGIYVGDSPQAGTTVANNKSFNNGLGIFLRDSKIGVVTNNEVSGNCFGILSIDTDGNGDSGKWQISGNSVHDNTRACPSGEGPPTSGGGIVLASSSGNEVSNNNIVHNQPSGPSIVSGGIVVASITGAPNNNSVHDNKIHDNTPDINWDGSGSGNKFLSNNCDTSTPGGLCS